MLKFCLNGKQNSLRSFRHIAKVSKRLFSGNVIEDFSIDFPTKNRRLTIKEGRLARLADASAVGNIDETHVLVTVVSKQSTEKKSFLALSVDYFQKSSAFGKIPTTTSRREQGVTNSEVLISRVIDRSIRPLFPKTNDEIQILCNLLAFDGQQNPDVVCINTVSRALQKSNIPWNGPVGCVRVGLIDNKIVINPTRKELESSSLNLLVTTNKKCEIVMLEGWANKLSDERFLEALRFGVNESFKIVTKMLETTETKKYIPYTYNQEVFLSTEKTDEFMNSLNYRFKAKLIEVYTNVNHDKLSRDKEIFKDLKNEYVSSLKRRSSSMDLSDEWKAQFDQLMVSVFRECLLTKNLRCDGRTASEVRPISGGLGLFKTLHGSAVFQRGQTQVLCTLTFDSLDAMYKSDKILDMVSPSITNFDKNFMLHYEFPPYSTNEIGRVNAPVNRREIGHGALAEKSLYPIIPRDMPFTIRLLCEVLESNGSSSMASVCAGSLALLDAGVKIEPVCGVAMGLVTQLDKQKNIVSYKILNDIMGLEDYIGDMDLKIAGTANCITAIQVDVKLDGLPFEIIKSAIESSQMSRAHILMKMNEILQTKPAHNTDMNPVVKEFEVPINKRSKFIGMNGMNLKRIESKTGAKISPIDNTKFNVFAPNKASFETTEQMIAELIETQDEPELEFGVVYSAKIVEILESGVMVQIHSAMKPTLLPNRQMDTKQIHHGSMSGFEIGQVIQVKYFGRDPVTGVMRLSRKVLLTADQKPVHFMREESDAVQNSYKNPEKEKYGDSINLVNLNKLAESGKINQTSKKLPKLKKH